MRRFAAAGLVVGLTLAGAPAPTGPFDSEDCQYLPRQLPAHFKYVGNYKDAENIVQPKEDTNQIVFVRLIYNGQIQPYYKNWCTDYPQADQWLVMAIRRLTNLDIAEETRAIAVTDPQLFKYPFVYTSEAGQMVFSSEDAAIMREYLTRGGFWMMDDFWGTTEWNHVEAQIRRILPGGLIKDIPRDHEIFHTFYDIDEVIQVPSLAWAWYVDNGLKPVAHEQDGFVPDTKGVWDQSGRLVMVINHNTDLGDSYEHADNPKYPQSFSFFGYRVALNTILYAMTH